MASALRQLETIAWWGDTTHNLIFPSHRLHNKPECLLCLRENASQEVLGSLGIRIIVWLNLIYCSISYLFASAPTDFI